MRQSFDLLFASSNRHKYLEAERILGSLGIRLGFYKSDLVEIQSSSIRNIASKKARDAFSKCKRPVIVEDDGLFVDSLGGFPGPYSSYAFKTIGNGGILNLVDAARTAKFVSVISYCDGMTLQSFGAKIDGTISRLQRGEGWGYDPIFVPKYTRKTFAQMDDKDRISHRYRALKKFASWHLHRLESSGR